MFIDTGHRSTIEVFMIVAYSKFSAKATWAKEGGEAQNLIPTIYSSPPKPYLSTYLLVYYWCFTLGEGGGLFPDFPLTKTKKIA
jgi:hypothetical protein